MFWKKPAPHSFVAAGRVNCPIRDADVDVDECLACGRVARIVEDDPPYVVCTAWRDSPRASEKGL